MELLSFGDTGWGDELFLATLMTIAVSIAAMAIGFLFALIFSLIEYLRGHIFGGFPWNLISFSLVEINEFIQILSYVGTYSFNLLVVTIFLVPSVILFDVSSRAKFTTVFLAVTLIISNLIFGNLILNKHNNTLNIPMNTIVKIISPKIDLKRFFDGTDPSLVIKDLAEIGNIDYREKLDDALIERAKYIESGDTSKLDGVNKKIKFYN